MNWIIDRLKEKTTWRGITALLTALGVALEPSQAEAIILAGVALAGVFEVFFKDPKTEEKQ